MNIQTEKIADHQVRVTVSFDPEQFEGYKQRAAKRISRDKKIPGFRPGKAPYDFIRRYFGDEAIETQAIDLLIDEEYPKVLEQADIRPAAPGIIEDIPSKDPLTLILVVPLEPEVILGDYHSIRMEYAPPKVADDDVDKVLEEMRYNYATAETSDQPAKMGDVVLAKVSATIQNPSEGQSAQYLTDSPTQILLDDADGKKEQPYPGFSKALIGVKPGDEKKLSHKFPKTSSTEELQGKTVDYTVTVETVRQLTLPELNDEFAQSLGEFDTIDKLRAEINHQLEHERTDDYNNEFFDQIFNAIIEQSTIAYPPQLLNEEIDAVLDSLKKNLEREGLDLQTYLKTRELEQADFIEKEVKPAAKKRLEQSLVLEEIARNEKVEIEDGIIENTYKETLQILESSPDFKKRGSQEMRRMASRLALNTANKMLNNKILERLKDIVTGEASTTPEETKQAKRSRSAKSASDKSEQDITKSSPTKKSVRKKVSQGATDDNQEL
ncbi:MAG: trigger factor [Anaerolineae bacterium]|nr:trigger factor [Anaerolineae bacterium]